MAGKLANISEYKEMREVQEGEEVQEGRNLFQLVKDLLAHDLNESTRTSGKRKLKSHQ
jgi:hypothetical protein